jgi:hypothetical protein
MGTRETVGTYANRNGAANPTPDGGHTVSLRNPSETHASRNRKNAA